MKVLLRKLNRPYLVVAKWVILAGMVYLAARFVTPAEIAIPSILDAEAVRVFKLKNQASRLERITAAIATDHLTGFAGCCRKQANGDITP